MDGWIVCGGGGQCWKGGHVRARELNGKKRRPSCELLFFFVYFGATMSVSCFCLSV